MMNPFEIFDLWLVFTRTYLRVIIDHFRKKEPTRIKTIKSNR